MNQHPTNPLTRLDYPDVDVIRVDDTYYMVSTTMYFMPGCEILRSYDLAHWEHAAYVYDTLDSTPRQTLDNGNIYGQGMWAASLRYHNGVFYVVFVANDTHKTYLYTAGAIEGPWKKQHIEGFYHDCSLLFDDDGRVYLVYGNRHIRLTELKPDLSAPLPGGRDRVIVTDPMKHNLGYEGAHLYKIGGKYVLTLIHSLETHWMRTEACYLADSLDGEFTGGEALCHDMNYCGQGVAQGGIVDTPDGDWFAVLFQDRGAVGRIPILVPVDWSGERPVFGVNGEAPAEVETVSTRPGHVYTPLTDSDDFRGQGDRRTYGTFGMKSCWQFNHEPDLSLVTCDRENGEFRIRTDRISDDLTKAKNTLTQRMAWPGCSGEVTVDAHGLNEGDVAGLCALQSCYGYVAVTKRDGRNEIVAVSAQPKEREIVVTETAAIPTDAEVVRFRIDADFDHMKDEAVFFYDDGDGWKPIGGVHKMYYRLDHFTGYRFGLFAYSTRQPGGSAGFREFVYRTEE